MSWDEESWKIAAREYAANRPKTVIPDTSGLTPIIGPCPICFCDPCQTPSFCGYCRATDARNAAKPAEAVSQRDAIRRRMMLDPNVSLETLWRFLNDHPSNKTPETTLEALMYSLNQRGVRALHEPDTQRRLSEMDWKQKEEIVRRLRKPKFAKAWTEGEIAQLIELHGDLR